MDARKVEIVAHRGASADAPENTMAAFNLAWAQKADAVECDVIESFVNDAATMQAALETYVPRDNAMLFACLDELLHDISLDEPARDALQTRAMGAYERPASGLSAKLRTVLDSEDDDSTDPGQVGRGPR